MKISEEVVFRWVVVIGVAAASVIALALLVSPLAGALWGLALVCAGIAAGYRRLRRRT